MRTLWCRHCATGYASVAGDVPRVCPSCDRSTVWTTMAPADRPRVSYRLTYNDRRLLKQLRIAGDEP